MTNEQKKVEEWMEACGQTVRSIPTSDLPDHERILRVALVMEEALEFAEAMGVVVKSDLHLLSPGDMEYTADRDIDLVEAADALADLRVVVYGSECSLGLDGDYVFHLVHQTNLMKLVDGKPLVNGSGKVLKPEGWTPPTELIKRYIEDAQATKVMQRELAIRQVWRRKSDGYVIRIIDIFTDMTPMACRWEYVSGATADTSDDPSKGFIHEDYLRDNYELIEDVDRRPHCRACRLTYHTHGPECHDNCPTCGGR